MSELKINIEYLTTDELIRELQRRSQVLALSMIPSINPRLMKDCFAGNHLEILGLISRMDESYKRAVPFSFQDVPPTREASNDDRDET